MVRRIPAPDPALLIFNTAPVAEAYDWVSASTFAVCVSVPSVWVPVSEMARTAPEIVWVLPALLSVMAREMSNTFPVDERPTPPLKVWA